jgi:hypothetical protein
LDILQRHTRVLADDNVTEVLINLLTDLTLGVSVGWPSHAA